MGLSKEEDLKRKMVELGLQAGRKRVSPQTGYLHFFPADPYSQRQDTIPIFENLAYVYTLFRSKSIENIQEGKGLLNKLLKFESEGNFPHYLHEFPDCKNSELSAECLPLFFYLIKEFSLVLGDKLNGQIISLTNKVVSFLKRKESLSKGAESFLDAFLGNWDPYRFTPDSPEGWANWCICAQMTGQSLERVLPFFDSNRFVFLGKTKERWQEGLEPALTLLDLFMGEYYQEFSSRSMNPHPIHLKACLVHPFAVKGVKRKESAFTALVEEGKKQCLNIYFGNGAQTESLTVEAKKGDWKIERKGPNGYLLFYTPDEILPSEDESVECALYASAHQDVRITVNGLPATSFQEKDVLLILSSFGKIGLRFFSEKGNWIGHISKGNRSQQKKGDNYAAHDWKIGWRTLRRSVGAQVKIDIDLSLISFFS